MCFPDVDSLQPKGYFSKKKKTGLSRFLSRRQGKKKKKKKLLTPKNQTCMARNIYNITPRGFVYETKTQIERDNVAFSLQSAHTDQNTQKPANAARIPSKPNRSEPLETTEGRHRERGELAFLGALQDADGLAVEGVPIGHLHRGGGGRRTADGRRSADESADCRGEGRDRKRG